MIERAGEVVWVVDHLDDLDADFARFYRCDLYDLTGPRFLARAERVFAYGGIMAMRLRALAEPDELESDEPVPAGAVVVPLGDASMSGLIEIG